MAGGPGGLIHRTHSIGRVPSRGAADLSSSTHETGSTAGRTELAETDAAARGIRSGQRSSVVWPLGTTICSADGSTRVFTESASPNSSPSSCTGFASCAASSMPAPRE
jgi:hypothetical protein